jgi:hypothetical protein
MFGLANHAGRLLELWVESPVTEQEADRVGAELRQVFTTRADKFVIAANVVLTRTLPPAVADRFIALMRADNPRVERTGFLLAADAATFALQLERMIKEAQSPTRRSFRDPDEWHSWLAELLAPVEVRRLRQFAVERAAAAAAHGRG